MKKLLLALIVLSITIVSANAAESNVKNQPNQVKRPPFEKKVPPEHIKRAQAFEKKLGLTEEQKVQAREIRKDGFEKIKPIFEQIIAKKQEAENIKRSKIAVKDQSERLKKIDKEIKALEKQAIEIRKENMKAFEGILTKEQKKILKEMKAEGRKNFKANHPKSGRPPIKPCKFEEAKK